MTFKQFVKSNILALLIFLSALSCTAATALIFKESKLALIELSVIIVFMLAYLLTLKINVARKQKIVMRLSAGTNYSGGVISEEFPFAILLTWENGKIIWYNELFDSTFLKNYKDIFTDFSQLFKKSSLESIAKTKKSGKDLDFSGSFYKAYLNKESYNSKTFNVIYFVDNTPFKKLKDEHEGSVPSTVLISIDNLEDMQNELRGNEYSLIRNEIGALIDTWIGNYACVVNKSGDTKYQLITHNNFLEKMIADKFSILDTVRRYQFDGKPASITLSIGAASAAGVQESMFSARQALDMSLGRGGDQAAVKVDDSYKFYGGISKSTEKRTKVRSRIVASNLTDFISESSNVIIMGHKFPDLDAVGASLGVMSIAHAMEKPAYIVTEYKTSMAQSLLDEIKNTPMAKFIVDQREALSLMGENTLVVVVDTHVVNFVEAENVYEHADRVVVIDHHRKSVDFIKNPLIFFHDSGASSASEMVTELIQYVPGKPKLDPITSQALLAGIMLDTKGFVLRTGVRTFEAAAFLRSNGADTVKAKKLFNNSMDSYQLRNIVINSAEEYHDCAIAVAQNIKSADLRIIASQAADELLNINGINASFVLFKIKDIVYISARSLGEVNVQVVMESLGGGGHQTMAAAQLQDISFEVAMLKLQAAIDVYYISGLIK